MSTSSSSAAVRADEPLPAVQPPRRAAERKLHLLHVFPSFAIGGAQIRTVALANGLGAGYRHTVLALDGNTDCGERIASDVDCTVEPFRLPKQSGLHPGTLGRIRGVLAERAPDLLLTYNWGAIEWTLANRLRPLCRRHVHFEDGFGKEEALDRQIRRRVWTRRVALSGGSSRVVVPSLLLQRLATGTWRLADSRVLYIPNGIDCRRFAEPPADPLPMPDFAEGPGRFVVGTVGALRPEKNFARLIRAVAALPRDLGVRLIVVGDGRERPALEALCAELGVAGSVAFVGALTQPERAYPLFDVFALSSDTEQMPYTVIEAMAAGLPVVSTDVGDIKGMVAAANRDSALIVLRDGAAVTALAGAFAALIADEPRRRRIAAENRAAAFANFALETMLDRYDRLFSGRE